MELSFEIGMKVKVLPDYKDLNECPYRAEIGTVIGTQWNDGKDFNKKPFIDYLIQFPTGQTEPFGNWEIEVLK